MNGELFNKILIANRGEIACRVIKSARAMGIVTVAVYVEADARTPFVQQADEAYRLDSGSYLDGAGILAIAQAHAVEAIHPGYGFLSENAEFAAATLAAGLVFIGPPVDALITMGSKSAAKSLLQQGAVPLIPGYHGDHQDAALLRAEADRIGYPLLIKASAGGGGKGMRIVRAGEEFAAALASCQREAASSFGDQRVLLEKYLLAPRHIEIQVFADTQGHCVYLFERDCSVQRRHQKVLEEAPAPGLPPDRRQRMGETACAVARAVGYVGAGTVEFIVDSLSGDYFFMEMNTRLQVEHPVTEMITGLDLVEWQLRIACDQPLPLAQADLAIHGHALEARVYAEDPENGFLPSCGTLFYWNPPTECAWLRIDSGVTRGDTITPLFDPMLAKLIVWGETRAQALQRMDQALASFQVAGVTTNLGFLRRLVNHSEFAAARVNTALIERHQEQLLAPPPAIRPAHLALLALADTLNACAPRGEVWTGLPGWRLYGASRRLWTYWRGGQSCSATVVRQAGHCRVEVGAERWGVDDVALVGAELRATLDGARLRATVCFHGLERWLFVAGECHRLNIDDPLSVALSGAAHGGHLKAPMPGRVVALCSAAGSPVSKGAPLLIMEAMKMEHTLYAPADGQVVRYHFAAGVQVEEGVDLLDFATEE